MNKLDTDKATWRRFIPLYDTGMTPLFACAHDQRFSYRLYVPAGYDNDRDPPYPALVDVHGTWREDHRAYFADFCDRNGVLLIAPVFPASIIEPGEMDSYKFISFHDIRFDLVMIQILREVSLRYRLDWKRLMFFGFSGGAQFVHRFLYLHPELVSAASIAAPGSVTLLDRSLPWWRGVSDIEEKFGIRQKMDHLKRVRVHCVVGAEDLDTSEITVKPGHRDWCEGANDAGTTRVDRAKALARGFQNAGVSCELNFVEGAAHEYEKLVPEACRFFAEVLSKEQS